MWLVYQSVVLYETMMEKILLETRIRKRFLLIVCVTLSVISESDGERVSLLCPS